LNSANSFSIVLTVITGLVAPVDPLNLECEMAHRERFGPFLFQ
jgi:hypothetical protein